MLLAFREGMAHPVLPPGPELRPFQKEALRILEKARIHLICTAPTGSGKSRIYEILACAPGTRLLLVTPLVALARQQFARLRALGVPVSLASGSENEPPPPGETGSWIVSPESLLSKARSAILSGWKPNLLVVDECHCLFEWGEDFRPAFSGIPGLIPGHGIAKSIWLTATLPGSAREKLLSLLPDPKTWLGEFALPANLEIGAQEVPWVDRPAFLLNWLSLQARPGIVFVGTREAAERLSCLLSASGKISAPYHAGMSKEERKAVEASIESRRIEVIVATSAFGMGMDHPHLEWCVLWQAPLSLLALAQAMGRAGRNPSTRARALILWHPDDFRLLEWTVRGSKRRRKELEEVLRFLSSGECRIRELRNYFDGPPNHPRGMPVKCLQCDHCRLERY